MNLRKIWWWLRAKASGQPLPPYYYLGNRNFSGDHPNIYVGMLPEYHGLIYLEKEAMSLRGRWNTVFENPKLPLDLEIGCGNGYFFEHIVRTKPQRNYLAMELKFKPLVQTIRRVKKNKSQNGKGIRFHARYIKDVFAPGEVENVYIHFPDPWPKARHEKNRLLQSTFLNNLYKIQKSGAFLDFKTDSESYFDFMNSEIKNTPYRQIRYSRDLHKSEWATENFQTAFEKIFTKKGQPTFYARFVKDS